MSGETYRIKNFWVRFWVEKKCLEKKERFRENWEVMTDNWKMILGTGPERLKN